MTIVESIRESINNCTDIKNAMFVYGRESDTALEAAKEQNIQQLTQFRFMMLILN